MKYEGQIVFAGFVLGIIIVGLIIFAIKRKVWRTMRPVWVIELEAFYLNSITGAVCVFLAVISLVYAVCASEQGLWNERGKSAFDVVIMFLLFSGVYCLVLFIKHPSLVMLSYMDRNRCMKSISSENFTRLSKNIWSSENWIVIGERFVPKSCLISFRIWRIKGAINYSFLTIDGREVHCRMHIYDKEGEKSDEGILEELADIEKLLQERKWYASGLGNVNNDIRCAFLDYLELNPELDLINDRGFADKIMKSITTR